MSTVALIEAKNLCLHEYKNLGIDVHVIGSESRVKLELFMNDTIIWVDCLNNRAKMSSNGSRDFSELARWMRKWKNNVHETKDSMYFMMDCLSDLIRKAKIIIIALFIHKPNTDFARSAEAAEIYYTEHNLFENAFNKILALSLSDNFKKEVYGQKMIIDREIVIYSLINHLKNSLFEPDITIYPCFLEKAIAMQLNKKVYKMPINQIFLSICASIARIEEFISVILMINDILREIQYKKINVCRQLADIRDKLIIHHTQNINAEHHFFDQRRNNCLKELQGIFILGQYSELIPGLFQLPSSESYSKNVGYIYANSESKKFIVDISKEGSLYICVDNDNDKDKGIEAIPNTIFNFNFRQKEYMYTDKPFPQFINYDDLKSNASVPGCIEIIKNNEKSVESDINLDGMQIKVSAVNENQKWVVRFFPIDQSKDQLFQYRKLKTYDQIKSGQHSDPFELNYPTTLNLSYWIINYISNLRINE